MDYRKEIDGLRALAVLPVLFFHAGIPGFSGGFVGVDIFFVISGFLITGILLHENELGKFSFSNFYERRARRLLPAFITVLTCTVILSIIFLPPQEFENLGFGLMSSSGAFANIYYLGALDYFAQAAEERPLLHIWSLSVEEQFYIIFPILLFVGYKIKSNLKTKHIVAAFSFLGLALSLTYMLLLDWKTYNDIGFFSVLSRAWELLVGGMLAFYLSNKEQSKSLVVNNIGSTIGLSLVVYSTLLFDKYTAWPSIYTTIPVAGAFLLLLFTTKKTLVGRLLSAKPVVFIGVISYSLYLWHQPLFSVMRIATLGHPSLLMFCSAMFLSIFLAYLTYRYIETPFRNKLFMSRKKVFSLSLVSLITLALIGFTITKNNGFPSRFETKNVYVEDDRERDCLLKGRVGDLSFEECVLGSGDTTKWAVVGDSHSNEVALAMVELNPGEGVQQLSMSGCSPSLKFKTDNPACDEFSNDAVDYIVKSKTIHSVVFTYRHSLYVKGEVNDRLTGYEYESYRVRPLHNNDSKNVVKRYQDSFISMIEKVRGSGKNVYVTSPVPELKDHVNRYLLPVSVFGKEPKGELEKATSLDEYKKRHDWWPSFASKLSTDVIIIDSWKELCDGKLCSALTKDGEAAYFDDDHLTTKGAYPLVRKILITNKKLK